MWITTQKYPDSLWNIALCIKPRERGKTWNVLYKSKKKFENYKRCKTRENCAILLSLLVNYIYRSNRPKESFYINVFIIFIDHTSFFHFLRCLKAFAILAEIVRTVCFIHFFTDQWSVVIKFFKQWNFYKFS